MSSQERREESLVLTEREALDIIAFLVSSAEISIHEPTYYGSFRLVDAASRLIEMMQRRELPLTGEFLGRLKSEIDEKKSWMMFDREAYYDFLRANPALVAQELKRIAAIDEGAK